MLAHAAGFVLDRIAEGRRETRFPAGSGDVADFVGGSWFCPGSTALLRREALARVGPTDPALRRLEDVDWFVRFALLGGRLAVWPHAAALIEVARKPGTEAAIRATGHLRAKYIDAASSSRLPPRLANRLEAYLQLEMASNLAADGRWLAAALHLVASWRRVPRTTLHVSPLWTVPAVLA
jgi:GT2 family glycosyltransferase